MGSHTRCPNNAFSGGHNRNNRRSLAKGRDLYAPDQVLVGAVCTASCPDTAHTKAPANNHKPFVMHPPPLIAWRRGWHLHIAALGGPWPSAGASVTAALSTKPSLHRTPCAAAAGMGPKSALKHVSPGCSGAAVGRGVGEGKARGPGPKAAGLRVPATGDRLRRSARPRSTAAAPRRAVRGHRDAWAAASCGGEGPVEVPAAAKKGTQIDVPLHKTTKRRHKAKSVTES